MSADSPLWTTEWINSQLGKSFRLCAWPVSIECKSPGGKSTTFLLFACDDAGNVAKFQVHNTHFQGLSSFIRATDFRGGVFVSNATLQRSDPYPIKCLADIGIAAFIFNIPANATLGVRPSDTVVHPRCPVTSNAPPGFSIMAVKVISQILHGGSNVRDVCTSKRDLVVSTGDNTDSIKRVVEFFSPRSRRDDFAQGDIVFLVNYKLGQQQNHYLSHTYSQIWPSTPNFIFGKSMQAMLDAARSYVHFGEFRTEVAAPLPENVRSLESFIPQETSETVRRPHIYAKRAREEEEASEAA